MLRAMKCPRDGQKLAQADAAAEGHTGLVCSACHGAWVPARLVLAIQGWRRFAATDFVQELQAATGKKAPLNCPQNCGALSLASIGGIELDWCPVCKGIWFEGRELKKLLAFYPRRAGKAEKPSAVLQGGDILTMILLAIVR